jgi:Tol biopolymer transport system component
MRNAGIGLVAALVASTWLAAAGDKAQDAERLLKTGTNTELVDGNLKVAIEQYKKVVAIGDHATAAKALLRMAECYEKLGDVEARKIYEQVVRDYAEQTGPVAVARARLGVPAGTTFARGIGDRAVWTGSKVDLFGRVSADGRYVTYTDWALYGNLAVHDVLTGADHLLTRKSSWEDLDGGQADYSAISPDGTQVAYAWETDDREIRIVPLNSAASAEPRRVAALGSDVRFLGVRDWSPDGKSLAVGVSRKDGTSQFGVVSIADGHFRALKSSDWRGADRLAFSADSKYLAYDLPAGDADQHDVFVMAVDGSRDTAAVVHSADDRVIGWSPDGKQLLFTSDRTGSNSVWTIAVTNGIPQGTPELLKSDIGASSYPLGLTRAGSLFVYKNIGSRDIRIAGVDLEAGRVLGTTTFSRGFSPRPQTPNWSPDGRFIAYQARGEEGIAIRSSETGAVRHLRKLLYATDPQWSPDGKTLLVGGRDNKGRDGVFAVDVASGAFTPIVYGSKLGSSPRWSGDGTKIYYRDFGKPRILERELRSGEEREIFQHPYLKDFLVSPDGRTLAVQTTSAPSQATSMSVVTIGEHSARELARMSPDESFYRLHTMAWTPDSQAILFAKRTAGRPELWSVSVDTGRLRKFDVSGSDWATAMSIDGNSNDGGFSLSPDGRSIAFLMGKNSAEVWALENFLPVHATTR